MAPISLFDIGVTPTISRLQILSDLLKKAAASHSASDLVNASIHPDMKPLTFQVQTCSNSAKFYAVRVGDHATSAEPWEDNETTFEQLYARIEKTIKYLEEVKREEFDGKENKEIDFMGHKFTGLTYTNNFFLPNFFFHFVTAYDILRKEGVDVGKMDFLGVKRNN